MANLHKNAGQAAQQQWGWWYSKRFLLLRRLSQLLVLSLFLLGPLLGIWLGQDNARTIAILRGNYSSSLLFDSIPLTDPLLLLESMASGHWPALLAVVGALIVTLFYATVANRLYCSWVCPLNVVTDLAAWLRRKLGIRQSYTLPGTLRYGILLAIILGSALSGTLLWEWINPIGILGRGLITSLSQGIWPIEQLFSGLIFGFGAGIWVIVAVFLFDLLVVEHGWCGHLCPVGALYGVIGQKAIMRIDAKHREQCDRCMDCIHICPEPYVLREPLFAKQQTSLILDKGCISCARCIDVCPQKVFEINSRLNGSGAKK